MGFPQGLDDLAVLVLDLRVEALELREAGPELLILAGDGGALLSQPAEDFLLERIQGQLARTSAPATRLRLRGPLSQAAGQG